MLTQIPARLLNEWMVFYGLEPFGYEANFQGHALTASTIAEVNRDPKKLSRPFTAEDFMPKKSQDSDDKPSVFQRMKEYFKNVYSGKTSSKTRA